MIQDFFGCRVWPVRLSMVDGRILHDQLHSGHFVAATGRQDARMLLGESPCYSVRRPWVRRPGLGLGNG